MPSDGDGAKESVPESATSRDSAFRGSKNRGRSWDREAVKDGGLYASSDGGLLLGASIVASISSNDSTDLGNTSSCSSRSNVSSGLQEDAGAAGLDGPGCLQGGGPGGWRWSQCRGLQKSPRLQLKLLHMILDVKPFGYGRVKPGWEEVARKFNLLMAAEYAAEGKGGEGSGKGKGEMAPRVSWLLCRDVFNKVLMQWQSSNKDASSMCGETEACEWNQILQLLSVFTKTKASESNSSGTLKASVTGTELSDDVPESASLSLVPSNNAAFQGLCAKYEHLTDGSGAKRAEGENADGSCDGWHGGAEKEATTVAGTVSKSLLQRMSLGDATDALTACLPLLATSGALKARLHEHACA